MAQTTKTKRIGIDARLYGPIAKGLGRYVKEVTDRILASDKENEFVVFLCAENFGEFQEDNPRVKKVLVQSRWYTLSGQFELPWLFFREHLDFVHVPHFNVPLFITKRFVVTIHDLILTKFSTPRASTLSPWLYWLKNWCYKLVIKNALWRSEKIIAVSQFTKNDIIAQFKIQPEKIIVTYEGVSEKLRPENGHGKEDVLLSYGINRCFLLYVGNAYPHKNLEALVRIFPQLKTSHPDLQLVMVGREDYFYKGSVKKAAARLGAIGTDIIFPGHVTDNDLAVLFRSAVVYVFPSRYEGFGLPPLEAMAAGCPVASSNASCLPEILGDAALYFDPENDNDMAEKISRIINDQELRKELIEKGDRQWRKYSWDECAADTREIYLQVL